MLKGYRIHFGPQYYHELIYIRGASFSGNPKLFEVHEQEGRQRFCTIALTFSTGNHLQTKP